MDSWTWNWPKWVCTGKQTHCVQDVAEDLPVVEKRVEEEVTAEPEDGASAEHAYDEHAPADQIVQGLSHEEGQTLQEFAKDAWRLGSFELKVGFEKCMSQQCHNTIITMFMNQCLFLTVCREWFKSELTTIDQCRRFVVFLESVLICFEETEGIEQMIGNSSG